MSSSFSQWRTRWHTLSDSRLALVITRLLRLRPQSDTRVYLLLAILVGLILMCAGVLGFFYVGQVNTAEAEAAVTATVETTPVLEIVVVATATPDWNLLLPTAVPTLALPPMTCTDVLRGDAVAEDGEYTLYLNRNLGFPVSIYCHNMIVRPTEYITLLAGDANANFASTVYPGDELTTRYAKVRVDLHQLILDPTDRTFATVTGSVPFYSSLTGNDYGRVVGCNESRVGTAVGRGNIDLSGTNFTLAESVTFELAGTDIEGNGAQISENRQVVNLEAGGRCGWVAPTSPMQLQYVPSAN